VSRVHCVSHLQSIVVNALVSQSSLHFTSPYVFPARASTEEGIMVQCTFTKTGMCYVIHRLVSYRQQFSRTAGL